MAGLLSEARVAVHPLPSDEASDSASIDASIYSWTKAFAS